MHTSRAGLLVTALAGLLLCAGPMTAGDAAEDAKKALQGEWICVLCERGGMNDSHYKDMRLTVEGDRMTFRRRNTTSYTLTLDPSKEPKWLDIVCTTEGGGFKGVVCRGIYILDGNTLLLCSNARGTEERPRAFQTAGNFAFACYTFKRPKP